LENRPLGKMTKYNEDMKYFLYFFILKKQTNEELQIPTSTIEVLLKSPINRFIFIFIYFYDFFYTTMAQLNPNTNVYCDTVTNQKPTYK